MSAWSRCFGMLAILVSLALILPTLADDIKDPAQKGAEEKKAADPKKDADPVKGEPKKDADPPKNDPKDPKTKKADPKPPEEKVVYGDVVKAKIKGMDANSQKDFSIDVMEIDPKKVYDFNLWKAQQIQQMSQMSPKTPPQERAKRLYDYNLELGRRQVNLTTAKEYKVRASEDIKVRSLYPPVVYDDKGKLKTWAAKDLAALKAGSKLPGYPAEFEVLRPGQVVRVFMAKQANPKTGPAPKAKKRLDDDDDLAPSRPEVVMILVEIEAAPQR